MPGDPVSERGSVPAAARGVPAPCAGGRIAVEALCLPGPLWRPLAQPRPRTRTRGSGASWAPSRRRPRQPSSGTCSLRTVTVPGVGGAGRRSGPGSSEKVREPPALLPGAWSSPRSPGARSLTPEPPWMLSASVTDTTL